MSGIKHVCTGVTLPRLSFIPTSPFSAPSLYHPGRLIHCLLMGHVQTLPTLDELRSMRNSFGVKASPASRLSTGGLALQPSPATEDSAPTAGAVAATAQPDTLRIAQMHVANIALWFESKGNSQEASGGTGCGGEGVDDASLSSAIKAVYFETWRENDGHLGGLDLLLTLCAVPSDSAPASSSAGADVTHDRDKGELCHRLAGFVWVPAEGTSGLLRFLAETNANPACTLVLVARTNGALVYLRLTTSPTDGLGKYIVCHGAL